MNRTPRNSGYSNQIGRIIEFTYSSCDAVYLTGSFAQNNVTVTSDIDLIFITSAISEKSKLQHDVVDTIEASEFGDRFLDMKILTRRELLRDSNGPSHFFWWSALRKGALLKGEEITIELNEVLVYQGMKHWLDKLDETLSMLESSSKYVACCYNLYASVVWFHFIEKELLKSRKNESKRDTLGRCLDSNMIGIEEIYRNVLSKLKKDQLTVGPMIVSVKDPPRIEERDFERSLQCWDRVNAYCREIYVTASKHLGC